MGNDSSLSQFLFHRLRAGKVTPSHLGRGVYDRDAVDVSFGIVLLLALEGLFNSPSLFLSVSSDLTKPPGGRLLVNRLNVLFFKTKLF